MTRFQLRRDRLRRLIRDQDVDGVLVTCFTNVTYLTGFTGDDSFLLLTRDAAIILSDARYTTQLEEECPDLVLEIRRPGTTMSAAVATVVAAARLERLGFEAEHVSVGLLDRFQDASAAVEWIASAGLVEQLREIKDKEEVTAIRDAVVLAEKAFTVARASLRGNQTEKEVADLLEQQIRLFGGDGCSFTPIVAVGDRAALAHYRPAGQRIEDGDLLLIDWGARRRGYVSDLTRVLVTGKPTKKLERVYGTVLAAQRAAIDAVRPGAILEDVDQAARQVITAAGFGRRFGHSLGHGIGLEVHEQPRLAKNERRPLRPGMVVTIEPGIYLPGWGGVRIEDDVLVTRAGHELLSTLPKDFDQSSVGC